MKYTIVKGEKASQPMSAARIFRLWGNGKIPSGSMVADERGKKMDPERFAQIVSEKLPPKMAGAEVSVSEKDWSAYASSDLADDSQEQLYSSAVQRPPTLEVSPCELSSTKSPVKEIASVAAVALACVAAAMLIPRNGPAKPAQAVGTAEVNGGNLNLVQPPAAFAFDEKGLLFAERLEILASAYNAVGSSVRFDDRVTYKELFARGGLEDVAKGAQLELKLLVASIAAAQPQTDRDVKIKRRVEKLFRDFEYANEWELIPWQSWRELADESKSLQEQILAL